MKTFQKVYERRFAGEQETRRKMYRVLCEDFFQRYIPKDATVLDMAAGYCEFINAIQAKRKIALDVNPDVKMFAAEGVEIVQSTSTDMSAIADRSVDVVFTSNFFEHITKPDIIATLREVHRVLTDGGAFLILQPNIRFAAKDYWMFFDHITPIDDRSLTEVLELNGFIVKECRPRFLPYTTKSRFPKSLALVRLYLRLPFAQRLLGKQAFMYSKKVALPIRDSVT